MLSREVSKDFAAFAEIDEFSKGENLRTAAGAFADGVEEVVLFQGGEQVGDHGSAGHVVEFGNVAGTENGSFEHEIEERDGELGVGEVEDLLFETFVEVLDGAGFGGVSLGLDGDAFEEESAPAGPTAGLTEFAKTGDVVVATGFEKSREIEAGTAEDFFLEEEKGDNHTADTAVAVNKRVEDFEVGVKQSQLDQDVWGIGMPVGFPTVKIFLQVQWRRGNKNSLLDGGVGFTDPVLDSAKAAASLVVTSYAVHEDLMEFEEGVETEGTVLKKLFREAQGFAVVYDFVDVFAARRLGWGLTSFEFQDVLEVGLGTFDFRGEYGFLRSNGRK
jgi:hypothetical protein